MIKEDKKEKKRKKIKGMSFKAGSGESQRNDGNDRLHLSGQ